MIDDEGTVYGNDWAWAVNDRCRLCDDGYTSIGASHMPRVCVKHQRIGALHRLGKALGDLWLVEFAIAWRMDK